MPPPTARHLKTPESRKNLAGRISDMLSAYETQFGELKDRIERCEDYFNNRVVQSKSKPWKGAPEFHIPITKPRLSQRKAAAVQSTLVDPIFRFKVLGDMKYSEQIEELVQFHLGISNFADVWDGAVMRSMASTFAVVRSLWHEDEDGYRDAAIVGPYSGLSFSLIHPMDFVGYPIGATDVADTTIHGHKFLMTAEEVQSLQDNGVWLSDQKESGGDSPEQRESSLTTRSIAATDDTEPQELYDLIVREFVKEKGKTVEKSTRIIVRPSTQNILLAKPFEDPYSPYVIVALDKDERQLVAEESPAHDLQGLQIAINSLFNEFFWQSAFASRPAVLSERAQLPKGIKGYSPGQIFSVRSIGNSMPLPSVVHPEAFMPLIQMCQQFADSSSKVSDTLTGSPSGHDPSTATEENIKFQGFQISGNDDVRKLKEPMRKIAKLVVYYLRKYYANWVDLYPSMKLDDANLLQAPMLIELGGENISGNPQVLSQQSQMLIGLFAGLPDIIIKLSQGLPQAIPLLFKLVKTVILSTNLPNRTDLSDAVEELGKAMEAQLQAAAQQQAQQTQQPQAPQTTSGLPPEQEQQIMDQIHEQLGAHAVKHGIPIGAGQAQQG